MVAQEKVKHFVYVDYDRKIGKLLKTRMKLSDIEKSYIKWFFSMEILISFPMQIIIQYKSSVD